MKRCVGQRYTWQWLWVLVLCTLFTFGPAKADQPAEHRSLWPEVLTLEEAASFLRLSHGDLAELAESNEVPARRVGDAWRFSRVALLAWLNGDWVPSAEVLPATTSPSQSSYLELFVKNQALLSAAEEDAEQIGEAPESFAADEIFLRGRNVLLAPGTVALDLGFFYSESDNQQLVLMNGGIGLATVEVDTFTTSLSARYGLLDKIELFADTSYRWQDVGVFVGNTEFSGSSRHEFGDVSLGLRRTVLHEDVGAPDAIVTVNVGIPTGDSSYAVGVGLTLIKSIDPVVLFANANYRHTYSRDFADVTRLEPKDRMDFTLGYALALNDTLTLSAAVSGLFTNKTSFNNAELREQQLFSLQFGLTSRLAEGLYIEPTVSFGLNGPGNSFAIGVSLPYTF